MYVVASVVDVRGIGKQCGLFGQNEIFYHLVYRVLFFDHYVGLFIFCTGAGDCRCARVLAKPCWKFTLEYWGTLRGASCLHFRLRFAQQAFLIFVVEWHWWWCDALASFVCRPEERNDKDDCECAQHVQRVLSVPRQFQKSLLFCRRQMYAVFIQCHFNTTMLGVCRATDCVIAQILNTAHGGSNDFACICHSIWL